MGFGIMAEARLLALGIGLGLLLAVVYQALKLWRMLIRHGWLWIGLEDLAYWAVSGFAVFCLLYRENDGEFRLYIVGAVLASMAAGSHALRLFFQKGRKKLSSFRKKTQKKH